MVEKKGNERLSSTSRRWELGRRVQDIGEAKVPIGDQLPREVQPQEQGPKHRPGLKSRSRA